MSRTFRRYTLQEFIEQVLKPVIATVRFPELHIHATWRPTIADFRKYPGEHYIQAMYRAHLARGFVDIAQHATVDPDGFIWDGRPLTMYPASATGHNDSDSDGAHPFMFEMIGNFDTGQERLEGAQLTSSVGLSKAVIALFGAVPHFHREFTDQKTCPGSGISKDGFLSLLKEDEYMLKPEDANKIIALLGAVWQLTDTPSSTNEGQNEVGRLANELRKASGQPTT